MTYRKTEQCSIFCQLSKFVRRAVWKRISKPVIRPDSYTAVRKHFSTGRY